MPLKIVKARLGDPTAKIERVDCIQLQRKYRLLGKVLDEVVEGRVLMKLVDWRRNDGQGSNLGSKAFVERMADLDTTLADNWSWNPVQEFRFSADPGDIVNYIMGGVDWLHAESYVVTDLIWGGWKGNLVLVCPPSHFATFIIVFLNAESDRAILHGHVADVLVKQEAPGQTIAILNLPTTAWPHDDQFPVVAERYLGQWWHMLTVGWERHRTSHTQNSMNQVLREKIAKHFNLEELRNLCHDLDISYEDLEGETRTAKARELVEHGERHSRLDEVVEYCQVKRPSVSWK